ncbi:MAG: preprotein translocase subunit YajC [Acidimicrobiaceae bacterium]|nr:preprotein translocase subunit YajC [Acidimicrobiaceae bacterium]
MSLILPILVFAIFYFFIIRPKQMKLRAAQMEQQQITDGDRVVTRSGIYGRVTRISQDLAVVEVAPGIELVFDKRSVLRAPESVDLDVQLSGDDLSSKFSEDDFSELHDHLNAHSTDSAPLDEGPDSRTTDSSSGIDGADTSKSDDEDLTKPGDEGQH